MRIHFTHNLGRGFRSTARDKHIRARSPLLYCTKLQVFCSRGFYARNAGGATVRLKGRSEIHVFVGFSLSFGFVHRKVITYFFIFFCQESNISAVSLKNISYFIQYLYGNRWYRANSESITQSNYL